MSALSASVLSVELHSIKRREGMKFETARIHFLSEVFIAVALVVTSLFRAFLRFYLSCIGAP